MFTCKSYLRKPNESISKLETVNEEWDKYFVEVSEKSKIAEFANELDSDYLGGAILLKYGEETILDFKLWDYVDQLWGYLLNLVEEVLVNDSAETYFPDQPIKVQLKRISDQYILLSLENTTRSTWTLPRKELLMTLLNGSEMFFKNITESLRLTEEQYGFELNKIYKLKKRLVRLHNV